MTWRKRMTRFFLWVSVLAWGPLVGAKVFDLVVLAGAWSGAPPQSLRLLPYGPDYPVDTGEFFIPSSAALLLSTFGALVSGWTTPLQYRGLLVASALSIFATLILTVTIFWPMNGALWAYASHSPRSTHNEAEIIELVHTWIMLDWVRVAASVVGFVAAIRALSIPFPDQRAPADPLAVTIAFVVSIFGVAAFLVYFVSNI